ncbi:MAG: transposase [Limnobacter sp.]|nr:transposase [Limnobacter sp.]
MTHCLEFRQRVLAFKAKNNLTFQETSEVFGVAIRTLFRWENRIEPCTTHKKHATKINMEALAKDVLESPDDYQRERAKRFNVTQAAISHALKRLNIAHKKNASASKGRRTGKKRVSAKNREA